PQRGLRVAHRDVVAHTTASVNGAELRPYLLRVTTFRRDDGECQLGRCAIGQVRAGPTAHRPSPGDPVPGIRSGGFSPGDPGVPGGGSFRGADELGAVG